METSGAPLFFSQNRSVSLCAELKIRAGTDAWVAVTICRPSDKSCPGEGRCGIEIQGSWLSD